MYVVKDTFGIMSEWKFDSLEGAIKFRIQLNKQFNSIARFAVRGM